MDWYAWFSKAGLGPDLAAEYALLFARNELGAADIRHLDHAFLATMGVAVAKHRLEILKLARKESSSSSSSSNSNSKAAVSAVTVLPWRVLAAAAHRSARSLAGCLRPSVARRDCRASVPPRPLALCYHQRGGGAAAAGAPPRWTSASAAPLGRRAGRSTKPAFMTSHVSKPMLKLTNGNTKKKNGTKTLTTQRATAAAAAAVAAGCFASTETFSDCDTDEDDEEEDMDGGEEMPWESMFQDLIPT